MVNLEKEGSLNRNRPSEDNRRWFSHWNRWHSKTQGNPLQLDQRAPSIHPLWTSWIGQDNDAHVNNKSLERLRNDLHQLFLDHNSQFDLEAVRPLLRICQNQQRNNSETQTAQQMAGHFLRRNQFARQRQVRNNYNHHLPPLTYWIERLLEEPR